MIAAANATSRVVVIVLFGSVVAVWVAVESMTLLPLKSSGFGEGHVLPLGTFSTYSYRSCDCDEFFFDFLTIVRPTKVGNAIMTGIGSRQNPHTP
jgi:hypothetical protein